MTQVFIITGPPGAGKSTLSGQLAASFERGLHLHCDSLYNMVKGGYKAPWDDHDQFLSKAMFKAAQAVLNTYVQSGFVPVVDYVFDKEEIIEFVKGLNLSVTLVVLLPDVSINVERDKNREYSIGEERVKYYNDQFQNLDESMKKFCMNNSQMSSEECVTQIKSLRSYSVVELLQILEST